MRIFALLVFFFAASVGSSSSFATEVTKYYVSDKLSQSSLVFDGSGNLVGQERLKSFGEVDVSNRASEEWHHSYHGKQRHTSHGLIDFGARFYDPELGRFLTIDPRGFRESSPDSFNRYAFANNNPYRYTDPDGRVVETAWDFANIGIGAHSLANNIASKNWGAAAVDTVGLGLDALAAAVPFVPGGASAAIKAERAARSVASTSARTNAAASVENVTKGGDELVDVFRAVKPDELADIQKTGAFNNLPGLEGKYFTTSAESAASYAKQAVNAFGDLPYTIVKSQVPLSVLNQPGISAAVDRGIPAYVLPNKDLPGLIPQVLNYSPVP